MNKSEIIFLIIVVIAYIICSLIFNLPTYIHMIIIALIIIAILAILLLKVQQKFENEKISKAALQLGKILYIILFLTIIYGIIFKNAQFELYPILTVLGFISLFIGWFFKNEN